MATSARVPPPGGDGAASWEHGGARPAWRRTPLRLAVVLLAAWTGCAGDVDDETDDDTDIDDACEAWPSAPTMPLHVEVHGSDGDADGSTLYPFATPQVALERTRGSGPRTLLLGEGVFYSDLVLSGADADGVRVYGCDSDLTELYPAAWREGAVGNGIRVEAARDVVLSGFTTGNAVVPIAIRGGASAVVDHVVVQRGVGYGVYVGEATTSAELGFVGVWDTQLLESGHPEPWAVSGFGVVVDGAEVAMEGGRVDHSIGLGVLVQGGHLVMDGTAVADTQPRLDDTLGRGVHAQSGATLEMADCSVTGSADAGVFAIDAASVVVSGSEVSRTEAANVDDVVRSGDGIVVARTDGSGTTSVSLTGNQVIGNDRVGIYLEGAAALDVRELSGNTVTGNGLSRERTSIAVTPGTTMPSGSDGFWETDDPDWLVVVVTSLAQLFTVP